MNPQEYEARIVKILDAVAKQDLGTNNEPQFIQTLHLLLQDVENNKIFTTILNEEDVRQIIRHNSPLTSKQMIDLSILLKQREEPLKLMVPKSSDELTLNDVLKSRNLDQPKKKKYRNYRNKKKKYYHVHNNIEE
jgi:hypothetical protein